MFRIPRLADPGSPRRACAAWRGGAACLIVAALLSACAGSAAGDDDAALEAFLTRLGLVDLQVRLHEQALAKGDRDEAQLARARRLADLYATALLSAETPERSDELRRRIDRLLERFPDAGTGALRVSLAQADYQRAEKLVLAWLEDPRAQASRSEAGKLLERVVPTLDEEHRTLAASVEKLTELLDRARDDRTRAELEPKVLREQGVVARAGYLAAWAHYYAGLCAWPTPLAEPHFHAARREFRETLGLADVKDYAEVETESLGLEPLARARATVGLGLAEAALAQAVEAEQVFRWLDGAAVHATIREQADYWRLQSRLNVRRWSEAIEVATERVPTLAAGAATPGRVSFFVSLVRAGFVTPGVESFGGAPRESREFPDESQRRRLGEMGLQGLLRLRQVALLRELVTRYEIPVNETSALPLVWARGDQLFREAEKDNDAKKYQAIVELLTAALARPDGASDVATAGRCRWTLAWCRYRLKEYDAAAKLFQQAATALKEFDAKTAVEGAWMAFASYQHLIAEQPSARGAAIETLERLRREFPETPRAQQAGLQLARLQQSAESPDDALRTLAKIRPEDPQYAAARYETCRLEHQAWTKAKQAGGASAEAQRVRDAVDAYLALQARKAAPTSDDDERAVKAALLAVDVASVDETEAGLAPLAKYLEQAEKAARRLSVTSAALAELHYRRLQFAQRKADDAAAQEAADWLTRHATGSPYELTALVLRARRLDEQIAKSGPSETVALQREAVRVYTRLVALWGDSREALVGKKNTFVATSKLAHYLFETGQYGDAAARLAKALEAYPQDKTLLRRAALAEQRAGQSDRALEKWRTLLAGLEKGSRDWFEAKLGQLECLADRDAAKGSEVYAQFRGLYPALGGDEWRGKFEQVERRLAAGRKSP